MKDLFKNAERNNNLRAELLSRFVSGVMTDDERAALWDLPEGCRIRENAKIIAPDNFTCGEYVWIGEGAMLDASGGLEVGDHTTIGASALVWSHTSVLASLAMDNRIGSPLIARRKTSIGRGCFIGGPCVIYSGVSIGDRTVVMPMSVVTSDIPGNCMVAGSPAKVIREIDDAYIEAQIQQYREEGALDESTAAE